MGFKSYDRNMSFADMEMDRVLGCSRTQRFLSEIDDHILWKPIEEIMEKDYPVGKSAVGKRGIPSFNVVEGSFSAEVVSNKI